MAFTLEDGRTVILVGAQPGAADADTGAYVGLPVTADGVGYLPVDTARGFGVRWPGPWVAVKTPDGRLVRRTDTDPGGPRGRPA